jgi:hypothetical protein
MLHSSISLRASRPASTRPTSTNDQPPQSTVAWPLKWLSLLKLLRTDGTFLQSLISQSSSPSIVWAIWVVISPWSLHIRIRGDLVITIIFPLTPNLIVFHLIRSHPLLFYQSFNTIDILYSNNLIISCKTGNLNFSGYTGTVVLTTFRSGRYGAYEDTMISHKHALMAMHARILSKIPTMTWIPSTDLKNVLDEETPRML